MPKTHDFNMLHGDECILSFTVALLSCTKSVNQKIKSNYVQGCLTSYLSLILLRHVAVHVGYSQGVQCNTNSSIKVLHICL